MTPQKIKGSSPHSPNRNIWTDTYRGEKIKVNISSDRFYGFAPNVHSIAIGPFDDLEKAKDATRDFVDDLEPFKKVLHSPDRNIWTDTYLGEKIQVNIISDRFYGFAPTVHRIPIGPFDDLEKAKNAVRDFVDDLAELKKS
jgi:hypothetical protein